MIGRVNAYVSPFDWCRYIANTSKWGFASTSVNVQNGDIKNVRY
jgi:hypothetical protein